MHKITGKNFDSIEINFVLPAGHYLKNPFPHSIVSYFCTSTAFFNDFQTRTTTS
jgi:hypothetical protein